MARTRTKRSVKARLSEITKMIADVPPPELVHIMRWKSSWRPAAGEPFTVLCGVTCTRYHPIERGVASGEMWCPRCLELRSKLGAL